MSAIVTLKKGEGRTIKAGGAWIYDNEIDTIMGSFENGDIIIVKDFDGYPMTQGAAVIDIRAQRLRCQEK